MATPKEIAQWMLAELERQQYLYQHVIADQIAQRFGDEYTYTSQTGNRVIRRDVLDAFREVTGDTVIWQSGPRVWRERQSYDRPGRKQ